MSSKIIDSKNTIIKRKQQKKPKNMRFMRILSEICLTYLGNVN